MHAVEFQKLSGDLEVWHLRRLGKAKSNLFSIKLDHANYAGETVHLYLVGALPLRMNGKSASVHL